jgi:ketosteroid isomerase-like protein
MTPDHTAPPSPLDVVLAFNEAWNARDLEAVLALTSDDCTFESARPGVHGARLQGRAALREAWGPGFARGSGGLEVEDAFVAGDRVVQLWRTGEGHDAVRGVDVLRVRDGAITEKLGYVKVR